ncbi:MAG: BlaI/MecI/CopY family transcriptional regulator [Lachnospiraceae bacterium]|nr:BlaI/MecI/CopY family transcriptional regulator [Lachnospiraceae bacterium]
MKRLPDSELEIMMIIWELDKPVTRMEIERNMDGDKKLSPTTILSFLSRLEEKGFVAVEKEGKNNVYIAMVDKEIYVQKESWNILKRLYQNSIKSFLTALFDSRELSDRELLELEEFVREKRLEQQR